MRTLRRDVGEPGGPKQICQGLSGHLCSEIDAEVELSLVKREAFEEPDCASISATNDNVHNNRDAVSPPWCYACFDVCEANEPIHSST